ncbi:MAG TPA: polysaccharide biosynthesis protein [Candidatus Anaerobutyricum avicola]|nr:polysaccharide biosynthesis protein [Candidatus Anaerobutyricum avicola]
MSYKKTIFTGTLILTFSGFLSRILGFYNRIFLSNLIGAKELGIYQLIFPVYMLCFTLVCHGFETGISNLASRFYAMGERKNIHRLIRLTCTLSFLLSLFLLAFLWEGAGYLSTHLLHETSAAPALRIAALSLPFVAVKSCLHGYYIGLNRSSVPAASQLVEQCARVGSIYLLSISVYLFTADARIAAWGMVVGEIASTIYTAFAYLYTSLVSEKNLFRKHSVRHDFVSRSTQPFSTMVREFFSFSIPLTINHFSLTIINSLENMLIPFMLVSYLGSQTRALECYGTLTGMALPFLFFPATIVNSLSVMLLPAISFSYKQKKMMQIRSTIAKSLHYCIIIGIFSTFGFLIYGNILGNLVFGSEEAGHYVYLFAILCPFMYAAQTLSSILNGFGSTRQTLYHNLLGMAMRIFFILTMIPSCGIRGYLYGLLAGYIVQILLDLFCILKITTFPFSVEKTLLLPAALSLAGGWLSEHLYQYLLLSGGLHPFWMLIICGLFYCAFFMSIQCLVERFSV